MATQNPTTVETPSSHVASNGTTQGTAANRTTRGTTDGKANETATDTPTSKTAGGTPFGTPRGTADATKASGAANGTANATTGSGGTPDGGTAPGDVTDPRCLPSHVLDAQKENRVPVDTLVTGEIPGWLSGTLYRNGCGLYDGKAAKTTHLFEGFAILHRYDVSQGAVKYTSRVLDRDAWQRAVKAQRTMVAEDGSTKEYTDPCVSTFSSKATYYTPGEEGSAGSTPAEEESDSTGVNIVRHSDKLFALSESPVLQEVHTDTLQRKSKIDLQKILSVHMATAHPHFGRDGAMFNLATAFAPPNNYNIIKMPAKSLEHEESAGGKIKLVASVQSRWNFGLSYSHSFGMSEKHFVILEQPATLSTVKIMEQADTFQPTSVFKNFELHHKEKIRFYVISRRQGNRVLSVQYVAPPCFTFHFVNCYDDGDHVVVDLTSYDRLDIVNDLMMSNVGTDKDIMTCTVRRYVLPLNIDKMPVGHNLKTLPYTTARAKVMSPGVVHLTPDYICKPKDKVYLELPRINYEMCAGRKYQFVYGTAMLTERRRLIKLDLVTRTPVYWEEEGLDPGEPVFVPRPGATQEDDGVIMSPVISLRGHHDKACFLLFLDARSFTEIARATAPPGVRIAMSFHGNFYTTA